MTATYKKTRVTKQVLDTCHCNNCGSDMSDGHDGDFYGLVEQSYQGGYNSEPLNDLTTYTFSICETCMATLFLEFNVPPAVTSVYGETSWEEEHKAIEKSLAK